MKKMISALLAAVLAGAMAIPALAAPVSETRNIFDLSGSPIDADGRVISGDTVAPGQTIYFLLPGNAGSILNNTKDFKVSVKKTTNAKLVKTVALTEKRLTSNATGYVVPNGYRSGDVLTAANGSSFTVGPNNVSNTISSSQRNTYLAVTLNDSTSTDEIKVALTATFTARRNASSNFGFTYGTGNTTVTDSNNQQTSIANQPFLANPMAVSGDKLTLNLSFFVANPGDSGGNTSITVGSQGVSVKPLRNEENEIIFEGAEDTMATLRFRASSNPDKFYAKLTTKWTSDLLSKFRNTDAVIRRFTPATVPSTSRATLALNNPYDSDLVKPSKINIYLVSSSGVLSNITNTVRYNSDEDTFEFSTRALGTYIISDTKIKL